MKYSHKTFDKDVSDFSKDYLMPILGTVGFVFGLGAGIKLNIDDFKENKVKQFEDDPDGQTNSNLPRNRLN